jgi:hypothetical protein
MSNDKCTCLLCQPVDGKRVHPVYGYDLDLVTGQSCISCGDPIGDAAYVEELGLARFGSMQFRHATCEDEKAKQARLRMERNWHNRRIKRSPNSSVMGVPEVQT